MVITRTTAAANPTLPGAPARGDSGNDDNGDASALVPVEVDGSGGGSLDCEAAAVSSEGSVSEVPSQQKKNKKNKNKKNKKQKKTNAGQMDDVEGNGAIEVKYYQAPREESEVMHI